MHERSLSHFILDLIFEMRNFAKVVGFSSDDVMASERNLRSQLAKIEDFIFKNVPVHMILPAFPAKSPNAKKTVTNRPDYGEVLALRRLNLLCDRIAEIYSPGARMTICSDGRVFSDVVQVSDSAVDIYSREIRDIIDECELSNLSTFSLEDVFSAHNYDLMRTRLVSEFAEDLDTIRERTKTSNEAKSLFNGIHRFMFEDQLVLNPERTKSELRERSKHLAYEVIRRSNAWSRLVENRFPGSLRLSIHPQPLHSSKIGITLLASNDCWRTPWHSVTIFDGTRFYLSTREKAEAEGGVLTYAYNKYPYYILPVQKPMAFRIEEAVT